MSEIKTLLESIGLEDDKAKELVESIESHLATKVDEIKTRLEEENQLAIAKKLEALASQSEIKLHEELETEKNNLKEYHEYVIAEELAKVQNELKIVEDVKQVRNGLNKVLEGLKEAGLENSQIFENVAAHQIEEVNEKLTESNVKLEEAMYQAKRYQRAFVVSEETRDLSLADRDYVISVADSLDEDVDIERFTKMVGLLVEEKKLTNKVKKEDDDNDDGEAEKSSDDTKKDNASKADNDLNEALYGRAFVDVSVKPDYSLMF